MRNVSNRYIETMRTRRDFYAVAEITFLGGAKKILSESDFCLSGNSITESAESNSFPLGILAAKRITISLMNDDERWSDYAFYGAKIRLYTDFQLDEVDPWVGRNLLKNSATTITWTARNTGKDGDNYNFSIFHFTVSKLEQNKTYTFSADINITAGTFTQVTLLLENTGITEGQGQVNATITGNRVIGQIKVTGTSAEQLLIYAGLAGSTRGNAMTITHFKLEEGAVDNPVYSLAPEDIRTERLNIGEFTVITPENYGTTISITAMDDSYKTDIDYSTELSYPLTAGEALRDSCRTCGVSLLTTTFPNSDYVIPAMPTNLTHRQFIGLIAMIAGGNAVLDEYNRLIIKPYDFAEFEKTGDEWGGIFDNLSEDRYMTGDAVTGGVFNPWDVGEVDDPVFSDLDNVHFLYDFSNGLTIESDDVVITGVQINSTDENNNAVVHLYGSEGYVLSVENQLATGKENDVVRRIGQTIVGLRFRPFSGDHIAYPLAEFMDLAYLIDRVGRAYRTVLTDVNFSYFGFTSLKCTADSPIRNSSTYYSSATSAVVQARKLVEQEKTDRERAVEELAEELSQSGGLYMTTERQDDGSTIYYMHNKPSLDESIIIWKLTENALGISTDGGDSYPYGLDVTGMAILSRIYAIGINADYVNAGKLAAKYINASTLSAISANMGTITAGILKSANYSYRSGNFSTAGFYLDLSTGLIRSQKFGIGTDGNAYFSGNLDAAGGTFKGVLSAATGTFNGTVSAGNIIGSTITGSSFETDRPSGYNAKLSISEGAVNLYARYGIINNSLAGKIAAEERTEVGEWGDQSVGVPALVIQASYMVSVDAQSKKNAICVNENRAGGEVSLFVKIPSYFSEPLTVNSDFYCGGAKERIVETKNYLVRSLYCYEMPSPMFGDIGEGMTDENGECYIYLDDIFSETVSAQIEYQVFLQKEGPGDIWIAEKTPQYFFVKGTENLKFAWEIKAKQRDYEYERLETYSKEVDDSINYEQQYLEEIEKLIEAEEEVLYETA